MTAAHRDPVLVAARRTPIGTAGHAFADATAADLAAVVLADVAERVRDLGPIDDVVLGNCVGPGGNIARVSALQAGLGVGVPGVTVDRQCGSGLDAVVTAAMRVRAGDDLILAGGVESASTAPWRFVPPSAGRDPVRYTRAPFTPANTPDPDMGVAADDLARDLGIDRERQDRYAARSHRLAAAADFSAEIVPTFGRTTDERIRRGLTVDRLARLRPAFDPAGTATAGNSCGISDGAAVLAVTTAERARGRPALRVLGSAVAATDPALPGLSPVPAIRAAVARSGLTLADIGVVEITEAFASVVLAVVDALDLDPERVCPDGGAIAMGHPWGASGAVLLVRLAALMSRDDSPEFGLAACAIGGGQGVAMVVQRTTA